MNDTETEIGPLADRVAAMLEQRAEPLVAEWIEWIKHRVDTGTVNALPDVALRNHIPPVLTAIARYVRTPLELVRAEVLGHLELHGHIRWEQGYGIEELLAEFDGLAQLVSRTVVAFLAEVDDAPPRAVAEVVERVGAGLRSIGHLVVSLYRKTEREQQAELGRQLDEFARSIAHEIRGPLNAAKLGVALLGKAEIAGDERRRAEHVRIVRKSIERTSDLLDDLQILAIAQTARADGRQIDLQTAIRTVRDELRGPAAEHDVDVRVEGDVPQVRVASVPLQLALMNVIGNAIKYCDRQKVQRWVRIGVQRVPQEQMLDVCEITIEDNGLGIPQDLQQSVFQRRVRAHPEVAEGTGLGLSITRHVVQQHGGSIGLESRVGEGTVVRFTLPAVDDVRSARRAEDLKADDLAGLGHPSPTAADPAEE